MPTSIFAKRDKKASRELLSLPQDKTLILFGADYTTERKGFKYLVEALKLCSINKGISDIGLVIFGNCIEAIPEDIELPVYPLGSISNELLLSSCYSAVDMLIIPTLEDNFPNTILESFACATPAIGFAVGGVPETIEPHKTGLLANLKNSEDLAEKIEWMVNHPKERQEMGSAARKLVEQRYALGNQAKNYLELYKRLL